MKDLPSNQFYSGLNRRFERRAKLLRRFGFKYRAVRLGAYDRDGTIGVFTRRAWTGKAPAIQAASVIYAPARAWNEELAGALVRPFVMEPTQEPDRNPVARRRLRSAQTV